MTTTTVPCRTATIAIGIGRRPGNAGTVITGGTVTTIGVARGGRVTAATGTMTADVSGTMTADAVATRAVRSVGVRRTAARIATRTRTTGPDLNGSVLTN